MAGDHLVQPGVRVFLVLFQRSVPAKSRLQSWAAVIQHPEPAALRCERKFRKGSEVRPSVLPWVLSGQASGVGEEALRSGELPWRRPWQKPLLFGQKWLLAPCLFLEQKPGFSQTQLENFMSSLHSLK